MVALAVALLPLGTAFTFPCVTAMLSRVIPSHERGLCLWVVSDNLLKGAATNAIQIAEVLHERNLIRVPARV